MSMKKLRLNIPEDDELANAWLASQHDRSISIRKLIHDDVRRKRGVIDYFATSNVVHQGEHGGDRIESRSGK